MEKTQTVLSVHNLPFMGTGSEEALRLYKVTPSRNKNLPAWARELPLPMGLAAADQIVAVSPTYAKEILTPITDVICRGFYKPDNQKLQAYSTGSIQAYGILKLIQPSSPTTIAIILKKLENKRALLKEFQLDFDEQTPLAIMITRIDRQKGIDIALEGLRMISDYPWQAIF